MTSDKKLWQVNVMTIDENLQVTKNDKWQKATGDKNLQVTDDKGKMANDKWQVMWYLTYQFMLHYTCKK